MLEYGTSCVYRECNFAPFVHGDCPPRSRRCVGADWTWSCSTSTTGLKMSRRMHLQHATPAVNVPCPTAVSSVICRRYFCDKLTTYSSGESRRFTGCPETSPMVSGVDPSAILGGHVRGPKGREPGVGFLKRGQPAPYPPARESGGAL